MNCEWCGLPKSGCCDIATRRGEERDAVKRSMSKAADLVDETLRDRERLLRERDAAREEAQEAKRQMFAVRDKPFWDVVRERGVTDE